MEISVNWIAVIVAAIANFMIGFFWYSDSLFGKQWRKLSGISDGKPKKDEIMKIMILGLGSSIVLGWILTHSMVFAKNYLGTSGLSLGLMTGFFNWLGYMFPILLGSYLYERKPLSLFFINSGYWLSSLLVMGVIIALWM